jgi:hypothetical protein
MHSGLATLRSRRITPCFWVLAIALGEHGAMGLGAGAKCRAAQVITRMNSARIKVLFLAVGPDLLGPYNG